MTNFDEQSEHWVANFILNSMLRVTVEDPYRAYTFTYLRRAEMSFVEYENGRRELNLYIDNRPDRISSYLRALFYFESFVSQSYQAFEVIRKWIDQDLFKNSDNSLLNRLNIVYGRSKHSDKAIFSNQLPENATMPVWLSNEGIQTEGAKVSFEEMTKLLIDLSAMASMLSNPKVPE